MASARTADVGRRLSTGGGAQNGPVPARAADWRRSAWLSACLLLGLPYPWIALMNPPWTYVLSGAPLLVAAWLTRPVHPAVRLLGFAAFLLGAALSGVIRGWS